MPGMNGIDFLAQSRSISPDTTRILLTGVPELEMAIDSVNRGNLFRFLMKPCPTELFIASVKDGIRQYQLITAERELLSKTLYGSIKVMIDLLAVTNPDIFAKASRLRNLARGLAGALQVEEQSWEIELAAMLCQIGAVTIPRNILAKWQTGMTLAESENDMILSIPKLGKQLIKNIPRLENIAEAVGYQNHSFAPNQIPNGENLPLIARILKIILDYDRVWANLNSPSSAFHTMLKHETEYDPRLLELFRKKVLQIEKTLTGRLVTAQLGEKEVRVGDLKAGMVLSRDINDKNDTLIVSKGTIITEVLTFKLVYFFRSQLIFESIFIESVA
jgi:response regulator RpfG family c-di-GMP phosphodiesterase